MANQLSGSSFGLGLRGLRSKIKPKPVSGRPKLALLQYHLIAFLQPAKHFGLGAVRDPDVDG